MRSGSFSLLGSPIDLRRNIRRLFERHSEYLVLLLITIGLDAISTVAFMSVTGPGAEQNPLVRQLSNSLGIILGPPLGKLFQLIAAIALATLAPRLARFVFVVVILMNLFAFVVNMHVFMLH